MNLTKGKFYRMASGTKVECLSTTVAGSYPALLQDESGQIYYTKLNGQHINCNLSLVGEWKEKRVMEAWANVYPNGSYVVHPSLEAAFAHSGHERLACVKLTGEYEV